VFPFLAVKTASTAGNRGIRTGALADRREEKRTGCARQRAEAGVEEQTGGLRRNPESPLLRRNRKAKISI
jgi:hypothetical protein